MTADTISDLRYDEKTDEYSLVFKGKDKFNDFCNRIRYMNYVIDTLTEENMKLKKG